MNTQKWLVETIQLRVQPTPHTGLSTRREKIVLFGFAVSLVLGATNLTLLQAQQPKPKAESNQQNAKLLIDEESRSTTRSHSPLIKRIVLFPVRAGKSVGSFFTRKSNHGSVKRQSLKAKAGTTGTQPMVIGENVAAPLGTQIRRIEIDGKEIKTRYRVFVFSGKWIEAKRTRTGFILTQELRNEAQLPVLITFGKHKLVFSDIRISKFSEDWIVGIDKKPFSEEFATVEEAKNIKRIYYIEFEGEGLGTRFVVQVR